MAAIGCVLSFREIVRYSKNGLLIFENDEKLAPFFNGVDFDDLKTVAINLIDVTESEIPYNDNEPTAVFETIIEANFFKLFDPSIPVTMNGCPLRLYPMVEERWALNGFLGLECKCEEELVYNIPAFPQRILEWLNKEPCVYLV